MCACIVDGFVRWIKNGLMMGHGFMAEQSLNSCLQTQLEKFIGSLAHKHKHRAHNTASYGHNTVQWRREASKMKTGWMDGWIGAWASGRRTKEKEFWPG